MIGARESSLNGNASEGPNVPERHGEDDTEKRNQLQILLVRRYQELRKGSIEKWVNKYAVIFGNFWEDKIARPPGQVKDQFRKYIFLEWEDSPEFIDHIQEVLNRERAKCLKEKRIRREGGSLI